MAFRGFLHSERDVLQISHFLQQGNDNFPTHLSRRNYLCGCVLLFNLTILGGQHRSRSSSPATEKCYCDGSKTKMTTRFDRMNYLANLTSRFFFLSSIN